MTGKKRVRFQNWIPGKFSALKSDVYAVDHQDEREAALDHSKGDSSTDDIDQSSNAKVDEDMIVKYLANHVEIGANILISIFDYGGQTVFNVSTMFIYITIILFADNSVNHITVF
jgi:hypothetical protein